MLRHALRPPVAHEPVPAPPELPGASPTSRSTSGSRALRDPEVRAAILAEARTSTGPDHARPHHRRTCSTEPLPARRELDYEPTARGERRPPSRARAGRDPVGARCTTCMLGADGATSSCGRCSTSGGGSYDGLHDMLMDPITVQGLGDGGAHSSHRLRREHDDVPAHALGARPDTWSAPPARVGGAAAHPGPGRALRARRPRHASRPGVRADLNLDRLRRARPRATPSRCTTCPPTRRGWCSAPRATSRRSSPGRRWSTTASSPTPAPARSCGAHDPERRRVGRARRASSARPAIRCSRSWPSRSRPSSNRRCSCCTASRRTSFDFAPVLDDLRRHRRVLLLDFARLRAVGQARPAATRSRSRPTPSRRVTDALGLDGGRAPQPRHGRHRRG